MRLSFLCDSHFFETPRNGAFCGVIDAIYFDHEV